MTDTPQNPFRENKQKTVNPFSGNDIVQVSRVGQVQGAIESVIDAMGLGVPGLAADLATSALPWEPSFTQLHESRTARRESVPSAIRAPLEVAGSLAAPLPGAGLLKLGNTGYSLGGSLIRQAPQTAKWASRTGRAIADAGIQSGIAGATRALDELTPEGAGNAVRTGLMTGLLGAGLAGGLGSATEMGVRAVRRVKEMGRLDKAAFGLSDKAAAENAVNYGIAERGATDTSPIGHVLAKDEVIAPIANEVKAEASYQGVPMTDAQALMASYRRLSAMQRRAKASLDQAKVGAVGYDPKLHEGTLENIVVAKRRALEAAESPDPVTGIVGIPLLRKAVEHARVRKGEMNALTEGADIGLAIGRNKSVPGTKLITQSREAFLRKIPKMTDAEAEQSLAGILGRFPEQFSLTSSPLGLFGLMTSAVRSPLLAYRTMPIIRALEAKLGRGEMGQGAGALVRGTSARLMGGLLDER